MIKQWQYILPSHYAGYIINDDATNLTDEEFTRINAWLSGKGYCVGTVENQSFFRHGHELNANEGADCFTFIFFKDEN